MLVAAALVNCCCLLAQEAAGTSGAGTGWANAWRA
jgi:hypothetical protein